jgi:hypothetical protein
MKTCKEDFVNNPHDVDELALRIKYLLDHPNADRLLESVDVQACSEQEAWNRIKALCENM